MLNLEWLESLFEVEPIDAKILADRKPLLPPAELFYTPCVTTKYWDAVH